MSLTEVIRSSVPVSIRQRMRWILMTPKQRVRDKHKAELEFWRGWIQENGCEPETDYYRKFMMNMGNVSDMAFFHDKVCLDIGCGPKGSLTWLTNARYAIGLDPLVESYAEFGIREHSMLYLNARVEQIPLPTAYVDVVFSMNSLDHVDNLTLACSEIRRVLRPGGHFVGSLNLEEPSTSTEPWTLTENLLHRLLFKSWKSEFYKVRPKVEGAGHFVPYRYFYEECPAELLNTSGPRVLWCRFQAA